MFKKISILFVFAAIISMMAHSLIPHHEHGEVICFAQTHSEDSPHNADTNSIHACCLEKQDAIRSSNEDFFPHHCDSDDICDYHFPPVLLFIGSFFDLDSESIELPEKPYLNLYASVEIISANSLRGPPQS